MEVMKLFRQAELAQRGWRYRTRVDRDEIRWLRGVLRPGDVAVDVGAYKGGYTYWMRRSVGEAGAVLAVEPQAAPAGYLRRRVVDFGWDNVHVDEVALSSAPGTARLRLPGVEPSPAASVVGASLPDGGVEYGVRLDTLDAVVARRAREAPVRLVKCDVEGHELEVFRGASYTLEHDRPHVLFECEARHLVGHTMRDVFGHLEALGYRGSFFLGGERLDVGAFRASEHQMEGRRPYVNNFVFTAAAAGGAE